MFNESFYPTPANIIDLMLSGVEIEGKVFLEPSAGKGDIIDCLKDRGAKNVLSCEIDINLQRIVKTKSQFLTTDFFDVDSANISHIDCIIMNPPFNQGAKHILHAYKIAPAGCNIIALCNLETLRNIAYQERRELKELIDRNGSFEDIGNAFQSAERKTGVNVALVRIKKEGASYSQEFEGFFMEEDIEAETGEGVMQYSEVRNLVNRYVEAVKLFDTQLDAGIKMKSLVGSFYRGDICFIATEQGRELKRNEFKKELQKSGWDSIFNKMNLTKYTTRGVREDINKFVEHQSNIPFTMRNIYRMFEIVIGTASQRMDKAILEVFDKLTEHHHENRHHVEGWKTNSHYLVNQKFILPSLCETDKYHKGNKIYVSYGRNFEMIEDLMKALCYISGDDYNKFGELQNYCRYDYKVVSDKGIKCFSNDLHYSGANEYSKKLKEEGTKADVLYMPIEYGKIFEWGYFRIKAFKKGTMHFEFKDEDLWGRFNQRVSKLKGYPLYESKPTTKWQDKKTGRKNPEQKINPIQTTLYKFSI